MIGPKALTHKNTNKLPINKITQAKNGEIIKLYKEQFYDFSLLDFWEDNFKGQVNYTTLRNVIIKTNKMIFTLNRKAKKIIRQNSKLIEPNDDFVNYKNNEAIKIAKHFHRVETQLKFFDKIFEINVSIINGLKELKGLNRTYISWSTKQLKILCVLILVTRNYRKLL